MEKNKFQLKKKAIFSLIFTVIFLLALGNSYKVNNFADVKIQYDNEKLIFNIEMYFKGYLAINMTKNNGMKDCDMIILRCLDTKTETNEVSLDWTVKDYTFKDGAPKEDTELGGKNDISNPNMNIVTKDGINFFVFTFERLLNTGDPLDSAWVVDFYTEKGVAFAFNESDISYHGKNLVQKTYLFSNYSNDILIGEDIPANKFYFSSDFGVVQASIKQEQDPSKKYLLNFDFKIKTWGYFGIGLGSYSMIKTDMILAEITTDGALNVYDTWSEKEGRPKSDTDLGGQMNILSQNITKLTVTTEQIYLYEITFSRYLSTGDNFDFEVLFDSKINCSIAWKPESSIHYHNANRITFDIATPKEEAIINKGTGILQFLEITNEGAIYNIDSFASIDAALNIEKDIIKFFVTLNDWGFLGIGFSHSMNSTDMIVIEVDANSVLRISDMWAIKNGRPGLDTGLKYGRDDIINPQINKVNNTYKVTFERLLDTKDQYDFKINLPSPVLIIQKKQEEAFVSANTIDISFAWKLHSPLSFHGANVKSSSMTISEKDYKISFDDSSHSSSDTSQSSSSSQTDYGLNIPDFGRIEGIYKDEKILFTVYMVSPGYIGLGFSQGMDQADIIVVEISQAGELKVSDRFAKNNSKPPEDTELGGINDIIDPQITKLSSISYLESTSAVGNFKYKVTFQRKLNTNDTKFDYTLLTYEDLVKTNSNTNGKQALSVAWIANDALVYHGDNVIKTHIAISSTNGIVSIGETQLPNANGNEDNDDHSWLTFFKLHGIFLICAWCFLNTPSIIAMRHFKHHILTKYIHLIAGGVTSIGTIVLSSIAIWKNAPLVLSFDFSSPKKIHILVGFIMFVLVGLEFILGLTQFFVIYFSSQKTNFIHKFKIIHQLLGLLLSAVSYLMFVTGFKIIFKDYVFLTIIAAVFFPLCFLTFEVYFSIVLNRTRKGHLLLNNEYQKTINKLPKLEPNEIEVLLSNLPNKNNKNIEIITTTIDKNSNEEHLLTNNNQQSNSLSIVFYDNLVCDVSKFIDHHPGGDNNLRKYVGKDVSRFLSGTYPANKYFNAHKHLNQTILALMDHYAIGSLKNNNLNLTRDFSNNSIDVNSFHKASLESIDEIAKETYQIEFKIEDENHKIIRFAKALPGIEFFGKHFSVFSNKLNKTRYYSICLALNKETYSSHKNLLDKLLKSKTTNKENNAILTIRQDEENKTDSISIEKSKKVEKAEKAKLLKNNEGYQNTLELFLKKYNNPDSMSNILTNKLSIQKEQEFMINGPLGRGLGFSQTTVLQGTYIILSGGTGIFSFLDFVQFTLRYMNNLVKRKQFIKQNNNSNIEDAKEEINDHGIGATEKTSANEVSDLFEDEDFSFVRQDFKLVLFSSFSDEEASVFHGFCSKLQLLESNYQLNVFNYFPRFSNKDKFKWNEDYLNSSIKQSTSSLNEISKVFISGPYRLIEDLIPTLTNLGLENKVVDV